MRPEEAQRIAESCLCLSARSLARALTNRYDTILRPSELRMTQFTILTYLRALGEQTVGELARIMGIDQTTMSRNVAVLHRAGFVTTSRQGRQTTIAPTERGLEALSVALPLWEAAHREMADAIGGGAEWIALRRTMTALTAQIEGAAAP